MIATILVPLDGSSRAEAILPHVESLANCFGAEVVLLQVIEPSRIPIEPQAYLPELEQEVTDQKIADARDYLIAIQDRLCAKGLQVVRIRVETGMIVENIIASANEENADLICIASHGRSGLRRVFYGSIAEGVLQKIERPLYLIRSV